MIKSREKVKMKSRPIILLSLLVLFIVLFIIFIVRVNAKEFIQVSEGDVVVGNQNAPVTFVMFSRYKCSFSKKFFTDFYSKLKSEYIDTGKVKFVYKHYYMTDNKDHVAAEASLCANEQGRFLDYHLLLYEKESEWAQRIENKEAEEIFNSIFVQYAKELGLDEKAFLNCLYEHNYHKKIEEDYFYAIDNQVLETPTFFINGLMIKGMPSIDDLDSVLSKFNYG